MATPITKWVAEYGTSVIGEYHTKEGAEKAELRESVRVEFPTIYGDSDGCRLYFEDLEQWAKEHPRYWARLKKFL